MLLTFLGLTLATTTSTELQIATNYRWSQQALYNAEAGLEAAKLLLAQVAMADGDFRNILPTARAGNWSYGVTGAPGGPPVPVPAARGGLARLRADGLRRPRRRRVRPRADGARRRPQPGDYQNISHLHAVDAQRRLHDLGAARAGARRAGPVLGRHRQLARSWSRPRASHPTRRRRTPSRAPTRPAA